MLRVNIGLALTGAIVGEFIASQHGLGRAILYAGQTYDIVSYGSLVGSFADFSLGTVGGLAARQVPSFSNPAGILAVSITGDTPIWTGAQNANWTTTPVGPAFNWKLQTAGTPVDFLATVWGSDVDFYQKILIGQGAFTSYLPARDGASYSAKDDYFGGQAVWADFSTWQASIPSVNYGIYTNEADAAVTTQLPGLIAGGSIDDAIVAIDAQIEQQIQ